MSRERLLGPENRIARIIAGAEDVPDPPENLPGPRAKDRAWNSSRADARRTNGSKQRYRRGANDTPCSAKDGKELPTVRVVAGQVPRAVDEAEAALRAAEAPIYSRAGTLVRPVSELMPSAGNRTTTVAKLRPMCPASMADHLARFMRFQRYSKTAEEWVNINPPGEVVAALLAREGDWRLPPVSGVITTPTMRPDGSILSSPGYDPATRLYLMIDPGFSLPAVPERPTRCDAERALLLLKSLIDNFPFVGDVDRAVALSGIMTAVVRGGIPTAPLHGITAHSPGTGKSYLVDIAATIATGRRCPVIAAGKTEEETEKRLGALLLDAAPVISIDNVNGELGGDALCMMTERPSVKIRILGASKTPEVEARSAVFATGNNLTLLGDMTRRAVICNLDADTERPELREFDFDPIDRVLKDRGAYVAAVLTIARAYRAAGMPGVCGSIGSYGEWSGMVRAPLIWLGCADPVASMDAARKADPELSAIGELITHWREHLTQSGSYTTRTIINIAASKSDAGEFQDLLFRQAGVGGIVSSKRLGKWLSRISGRLVDGAKLEMQADTSHGNRYSLIGPTPYPSRATEL